MKREIKLVLVYVMSIFLCCNLCMLLSGCSHDKQDDSSIEETSNLEYEDNIAEEDIVIEETSEESNKDDQSNNQTNEIIEEYEDIDNMIESMTLEDKVAQMFFVHSLNDDLTLKKYQVGGILLFSDSFEQRSKEEVISYIEEYQQNSTIPLLIGVDEEGGTVTRVSRFSQLRDTKFQSPQNIFSEGGMDKIIQDTYDKSKFLKSLGINVNLGPVADVSIDENSFMYNRTFGQDSQGTAAYVSQVVKVMKEEQIGSTLKHFPGYGDNVDTHEDIAIDSRELSEFEENDFLPFISGIEAGADSILVAHNIVESMDSKYPASISINVHTIIRDDLNFQGVIMTDDLGMEVIKQYSSDQPIAVLAINAGNDMLISTDYETQITEVIDAVHNGSIEESRINESVKRILIWKRNLGLL